MRRFFPRCIAVTLVVIFALLTGCSPGMPLSLGRDREIVALLDQPIRSLDPLRTTDAVGQKLNSLIHTALVRMGPKFEILPDFAVSWAIRPHLSGDIFTFTVRSDLRFHDGSLVLVHDVVSSIERMRQSPIHGDAFRKISKVGAVGLNKVFIETSVHQPFLLSDLSTVKIYKLINGETIVAAGQFKLIEQTADRAVLVRAIPSNTKANLLEFRYIRDDYTRYQMLMRGDVHAALSALSASKTLYLEKKVPSHLTSHFAEGINYSYLCFNFRNKILQDRRVRKAIAYSVDLKGIARFRYGDRIATPARSVVSPLMNQVYAKDLLGYERNVEKAQQLLEEAGFHADPKTGIRLTLELKTSNEKFGMDLAQLIVNSLRDAGISVRMRHVESGVFMSQIQRGDFQMFLSRWVGVSNASIFQRIFHSKGISNRGLYENAELDRLLENGQFNAVQHLVEDDLPYINIFHWNNALFLAKQWGKSRVKANQIITLYPNASYQTLADIEFESI